MAIAEDALIANLNAFTGFARARLGDPHLAADIVQESLLKALKSADKPVDEEGAVVWFYRILRRSIIDLYRRRDARDRALKRLEAELSEAPSAEVTNLVCQCFRGLLPTLPAQYQTLLQRIDLDGTPPKVVASELRISVNNLNVRLHRARKQLRERLEATCRVCSKHGCVDCSCDAALHQHTPDSFASRGR
jgi:RNA polymerase sigma factor (sigma-70 family)